MNLNKQMELATAIFGSEPTAGVERVSATATADSADGEVTVQFEDGSTLDVPVTGAVKSGDEVIVNVQQGTPIAAGAVGWGDRVQTVADEAQAVAEATNQHFWDDSNGAHVTEVEQDAWTDPSDPNYHAGRDILLNSSGILLREDYANLASFTPSAVAFYDGSGNNADNVTASFGSSGAVIGKVKDDTKRIEISNDGLSVLSRQTGYDITWAKLGMSSSLGSRDSNYTEGSYSATIGSNCAATAQQSFAQGFRTVANSPQQSVFGKYNDIDNNATYALIIGNGTADNARSNALTVAWNGDIVASGEVTDGYGNRLSDAGGYNFVRYIPTSAAAQSMSATTSLVNAITVVDAGDSTLVTCPSNGIYEIQEAGTYRISAQCGMYPNTTAKTRLCVGLYDTTVSGTRLAIGIQQMYNATANNAAQVVTIACEYVGVFAAGDRVALGAFADVTAAKVVRGGSGDLTRITFEKVG